MSEALESPDPAAAFEALREEVAQLRTLLESRGASEAVDYTPSLAALTQRLKGVEGRLEGLEQRPALKLTPEGYARSLEQGVDLTRRQLRGELGEAHRALSAGAQRLEAAVGGLRERRRQTQWVIGAAGAGAVVGVLLWVGFSGPVARTLPGQVAERMAAATLGKDRAEAGQQLLKSGDPAGWNRAVEALQIYRANEATITACAARRGNSSKSAPCRGTLVLPPAS